MYAERQLIKLPVKDENRKLQERVVELELEARLFVYYHGAVCQDDVYPSIVASRNKTFG